MKLDDPSQVTKTRELFYPDHENPRFVIIPDEISAHD